MPASFKLSGKGWTRQGGSAARGQAFSADGRLLRADDLAALFDRAPDGAAWAATAGSLNGCFAAVRLQGDVLLAAVDRLRTIPLFFADGAQAPLVADSADAIAALLPRRDADFDAREEFRLTGYVTGSGTLIRGIRQIPAGHCLSRGDQSDAKWTLTPYYAFRHRELRDASDEMLIDGLIATHESVFRRLLADVGDRPVIVPMSGGYDSRLIGVMLRDLGCKNVLCYTYGIAGNWESRISRELAQHLGFRWTMVPYSPEAWRGWASTPAFQAYFRSAGNFASLPHIQDWPAVHELVRRGELDPASVFVPGHSGDFLAGSHIPKWYAGAAAPITREQLLQSLFDAHYSLWEWPEQDHGRLREVFSRRVEEVVGPLADSSAAEAADRFEYWDCQERQAKFIVNSVRVYESFGFEWRLPLFDHELMDFWSRVPLNGRIGRRLYFRFANEHQRLPITEANTDRPAPITAAIGLAERLGLRPIGKRAQRAWRRLRRGHIYEHSPMAWLSIVAPEEFRARYTGREIGHSFFALKYLHDVAAAPAKNDRVEDTRGA